MMWCGMAGGPLHLRGKRRRTTVSCHMKAAFRGICSPKYMLPLDAIMRDWDVIRNHLYMPRSASCHMNNLKAVGRH